MTDFAAELARAQAKAIADSWDPRWIVTPADARATLRGYRFNLAAAERVASFLEKFCRHAKGRLAGQAFKLEPWQFRDLIGPLYGWVRPDGTRRFRGGYVSMAKKNGKTAIFGVALPLYHVLADGEASPLVGLVAADRWQASQAFDDIALTVRKSPALAKVLEVIDSRKVIVFEAKNGKLEAFSADVPTKEGISASFLNYDELHAIAFREMFDTLRYAGAARLQALMVVTTTAGVVDETSVCWEQYQYAKGVLDGTIDDDTFFPAIYEPAPELAYDDPAAWQAANPNLGITIMEDEIAQQATAAGQSPALRSAFERYRLNRWQSQSQAFLDLGAWDACDVHPICEAEYAGRRAFGGLDLAATSDLNALAWLFPCPHDPEAIDVVCRAWVPTAALEKSRAAHLYRQWADAGALTLTPGAVSDYGFIRQQVIEDAERWPVDSLGLDRLFQGLELATALSDEGLNVFPVGMGFTSMGPLMKELERLVLSGRLHHGGHPVLRWCLGNVQVRTDPAGNMKPSRESANQKIDLVIAVLLGLDRYLRRPQAAAVKVEPRITLL